MWLQSEHAHPMPQAITHTKGTHQSCGFLWDNLGRFARQSVQEMRRLEREEEGARFPHLPWKSQQQIISFRKKTPTDSTEKMHCCESVCTLWGI